ncbi:FAD-dependent oxidoreductase [Glaciibacter sp. 2TAF33]|uniref:FAD-dependent oxidoreductase n=1 Tax=Glaciibacter sp. 2TAF33 TaxID=3233015 RepID=UPI003F9182C9
MSETQFDADFDVIVVGAGAAGLSAALTAIETDPGARIAVLERGAPDIRGGNTRWSGAYLRLQDTTTPVANLVDYAVGASKGYASREYYESLVREVPEAFDWLHEQGVVLKNLPTIFLTQSASRYQPVGGGVNIVEPLFERLEATDATILYETAAETLLTDTRGTVVGVRVRDESGTRNLRAGAVVLACGGFQGNRELMAKYVGRNAYRVPPISRGGANNRGDGLRMALEVGAATEGQFDLFHAEPKDPRSDVAEAVVMSFPYGILINTAGERFMDESAKTVDLTYESVARNILQQEDSIGYAVFDQQVRSVPGYEHAIGTDVDPIQADSILELEALIGLPPGSLVRTVAEFNAACDTDAPFDWSRLDGVASRPAGQPAKSNWARALTEGPFFAYPQICANVFTFGGVKTDLAARVVTSDGHPICGLYGAGEMTGLYYEAYAGSTSVMRSITFGRIAGREAARLALSDARVPTDALLGA